MTNKHKEQEQQELYQPDPAPREEVPRPPDTVPLGGNEPGVPPPSTAGTSYDTPDK